MRSTEQIDTRAAALAAKTDLLSSGVAVDEHARVAIENEASNLYEASPWAEEKRAVEIVRLAPVLTADGGPAKKPSTGHGVRHAATEDPVGRFREMLPEQHAIVLSAGGPGTGTCWTAMHKSPTELPQNAQRRMATALRLGATPDDGNGPSWNECC